MAKRQGMRAFDLTLKATLRFAQQIRAAHDDGRSWDDIPAEFEISDRTGLRLT
jgi:hypothetical protein